MYRQFEISSRHLTINGILHIHAILFIFSNAFILLIMDVMQLNEKNTGCALSHAARAHRQLNVRLVMAKKLASLGAGLDSVGIVGEKI
jgi:hypothetical protein